MYPATRSHIKICSSFSTLLLNIERQDTFYFYYPLSFKKKRRRYYTNIHVYGTLTSINLLVDGVHLSYRAKCSQNKKQRERE